MGIVILAGDIEYGGADDAGDIGEYLGKAFGVVHLVDVFDIVPTLTRGLGVANIVNVKAQGFGKVIEPLQLQFCQRLYRWIYRHRNSPK